MKLKEIDKKELLKIFNEMGIPFEVWAYGSRVSGEAHEGSDLDLVIRSPDLKPIPRERFMELKNKISESNIPFLVDLLDWGAVSDNFKNSILRKYEVLFTNFSKFERLNEGKK